MSVIIAPQFFSSLGKLAPAEQAQVVDFINTFQADPHDQRLNIKKAKAARSPGVWRARITSDLRAILFQDGAVWAILFVGHHKQADDWPVQRKIGRHSVTGALQIVESVETVREVERVIEVLVPAEAPALFQQHGDSYLLSLGLPEAWLPTLRKVRGDDQLLAVCEKLPEEVAERLFALATGELVTPPTPVAPERPLLDAADTQRRFFLVEDAGGLAAALEAPMDRWVAFLHPSQRALVQRCFKGPAKVSGSAGTGKTVVAMHRARHLARQGEEVLLASYVTTLCENIERNLGKLCSTEELARIRVSTVHKQALSVVRSVEPRVRPASEDDIRGLLDTLRVRHAPAYDAHFVQAEWDHVVRLQGIASWEEYRQVRRTGRGRGLAVKQRKILWRVFGGTLEGLAARGLLDWPGLCGRAEELLTQGRATSPYSAVIVDEVQDLKPPELRFLRALCAAKPGNLMVCGDAGQRIYPGGFSLSALGIEVRGRSAVLRINYRTTEQIRRASDRMLGDISDDLDGGEESRLGTRSLLRGPTPKLVGQASKQAEVAAGVAEVNRWLGSGLAPEAIGVFTRRGKRADELGAGLEAAAIPWCRLSDKSGVEAGVVHVGTMHRAKGLEFKAVLVLSAGDKELPSTFVLRGLDDPQDREAVEARERRLLYVAMTRARDELTVSWSGTPSRFLAPLLESIGEAK